MPLSGQPWDPSFLARSPWFREFSSIAAPFAHRPDWPSFDDYSHLAETHRARWAPDERPLEFALAPKKSRRFRRTEVRLEELYDGSIHLNGRVPCLPASYHDLWNTLVFSAFPRAKRRLHARQFAALARDVRPGDARLPSKRSRERDALTIFDEGGSVVLLQSRVHCAWRDGATLDPSTLDESQAAVVLFGHAILEQAQLAAPVVRSSALVFEIEDIPPLGERWPLWDALVAQRLERADQFLEPGADTVLDLRADGSSILGASTRDAAAPGASSPT